MLSVCGSPKYEPDRLGSLLQSTFDFVGVIRLLMLLSKQKSGSSTVWSQFAIRTPNLGADKGGLFARHLIIAMIWKPHTKWNTFWFKSFGTSGQALVQATDRNFIDSKPDLFKTENMHLIEAGSDSYIVRFQKLESKLELRTVLLHRTSNVPEDTFKFENRLKESANLGHTKSITNLRRICRSESAHTFHRETIWVRRSDFALPR